MTYENRKKNEAIVLIPNNITVNIALNIHTLVSIFSYIFIYLLNS